MSEEISFFATRITATIHNLLLNGSVAIDDVVACFVVNFLDDFFGSRFVGGLLFVQNEVGMVLIQNLNGVLGTSATSVVLE